MSEQSTSKALKISKHTNAVVMGPITNSSSPSADPDPKISEILWDCISRHRSCWQHLSAYHYRHQKSITLREVKDIKKKFKHTSPCYLRCFPHRKRSKKTAKGDNSTCRKRKKLDSHLFEYYMESLWKSFSKPKRMSFDYLDSLWFSLYREAAHRDKVLTWIKQKNIFNKKYVFVPIVCWNHWSLLILVHPGEHLDSKSGTPCMLLLDSLASADPRRLEPDIRKFVVDIYRVGGRTEDMKVISQIPLLVPKVPQQKDDVECGNYVLYFINLFMKAAPESFSISEGYPYFMRRDWFDPESLDYFCNKLDRQLPKKTPQIKTSLVSRRRSQRRGGKYHN